MKLSTKKSLFAYLFIAPNILLFFAFTLIPTILALLLAFKEFKTDMGILGSPWIGLRNFLEVFQDRDFKISLINTSIFTFIFVPVNLFLSFFFACLIFPLNRRVQSIFKTAFYLPGIISAVVIAVVWKWMFNIENGLINLLLTQVGLDPINWFGSRWSALGTVIISQIPYAPGVGIILYLAAMSRIPKDIIEASVIDGANATQSLMKVVFPLLKPTTLYIMIINTIESFKIFTPIYVMTEGRPANQSTVMVYEIFKQAFANNEYGMASAEALILLLIVIFFAMIQYKSLQSEVEY